MHCTLHRFHHRTLGYHRNPRPPTLPDARKAPNFGRGLRAMCLLQATTSAKLRRTLAADTRPYARPVSRESTDRQKTAPCRFRPVKRSATLQFSTGRPPFGRGSRAGFPLRYAIVGSSPAFRFNMLRALYQEPAHCLSAGAQT